MKDFLFYFNVLLKDNNELSQQAIDRGFAEYVVDSDGKTTWQWKEKQ